MGGGGLRILGHKKWHVWRRDNVERVLRDEREHEEAQRAARDEQRRRDQERRADALGRRAPEEHINLFAREEEAHTRALLTGGERAGRGKAQSETLGRHARLPWYATTTEAEESHERPRREDVAQDPLRGMRPPRDAQEREAEDDEDARVRRRRDDKTKRRREESPQTDRNKTTKKHKKHKKKRKQDDKDSARELMAQLRRERNEREAAERERAERLMRGH